MGGKKAEPVPLLDHTVKVTEVMPQGWTDINFSVERKLLWKSKMEPPDIGDGTQWVPYALQYVQ